MERAEKAGANARGADAWLGPGRFALLFGMMLAATFPRVLAGTQTFFYRDFGSFTYPLAFFHRESFWRGELPFWNPYNNCGLPFLAQWNTMTLYPGSLLYLLLPMPWSVCFFCLAHLFFGALGAYFLAYRWTGSRVAASVAGVAFGFNGLTWHALMWTNNIAALGWMPWVALNIGRAWEEGGARRIALGALTGAMQMLAGAPEVILLTWVALGALWLERMIRGDIPRARLLVRFALSGVLVACLAAAQLAPFLDLLAHSQRNTGFGDSQWAMPATGLVDYLVPRFRMQVGAFNPPSQENQYWTSSYYLGAVTMALALLALWRVRNGRVWVLAGLAVFSVLMAMGDNGPVYGVLRRFLPVMGFMRFPIKFIVLATFALPFLAAHAVGWLGALPAERRRPERNKLIVSITIVVVLMAAAAVYVSARPHGQGEGTATWLSALSRDGFLAACGACLIASCGGGKISAKARELSWVCLMLLMWLDVATHARSLSPTVGIGVYQADSIRQYYKWGDKLRPGESRAMPTAAALSRIMFHAMESPEDDFNGRRLGMFADYNVLDHAAKVDGFYSLYLREEDAINFRLYSETNTSRMGPLKDFMGVSWTSNPDKPAEWVERATSMPILTMGQQPVFTNEATALACVMSEEFQPREVVYLPGEAAKEVRAERQKEARIVKTQFEAQRVEAEVETPGPAMVVTAQAFYHRWRAYVDGKAARLWRCNYAFQAVEVPKGRHLVRLEYEDGAFRFGAVVSALALVACAAAIFLGGRARRS